MWPVTCEIDQLLWEEYRYYRESTVGAYQTTLVLDVTLSHSSQAYDN